MDSIAPSYKTIPFAMTTLDKDNSVVFYYLSGSKINSGLIRGWSLMGVALLKGDYCIDI